MWKKLQSLPIFDQARDAYNVTKLVRLFQGATFNLENHAYLYDSLKYTQQKNRRIFQKREWTLTEYVEKYLALHMAVEILGG